MNERDEVVEEIEVFFDNYEEKIWDIIVEDIPTLKKADYELSQITTIDGKIINVSPRDIVRKIMMRVKCAISTFSSDDNIEV